MAAPRASSGRLDLLDVLTRAFAGAFAPQQEDGLKALSLGGQGSAGNSGYGPNPHGLSGPDLVRYWSSLDANTPDKMNFGRAQELTGRFPGSQFAQWMSGIGAAPGQAGKFSGGAAYSAALGQGGGGGTGNQWLNPATPFKKIRGLF